MVRDFSAGERDRGVLEISSQDFLTIQQIIFKIWNFQLSKYFLEFPTPLSEIVPGNWNCILFQNILALSELWANHYLFSLKLYSSSENSKVKIIWEFEIEKLICSFFKKRILFHVKTYKILQIFFPEIDVGSLPHPLIFLVKVSFPQPSLSAERSNLQ